MAWLMRLIARTRRPNRASGLSLCTGLSQTRPRGATKIFRSSARNPGKSGFCPAGLGTAFVPVSDKDGSGSGSFKSGTGLKSSDSAPDFAGSGSVPVSDGLGFCPAGHGAVSADFFYRTEGNTSVSHAEFCARNSPVTASFAIIKNFFALAHFVIIHIAGSDDFCGPWKYFGATKTDKTSHIEKDRILIADQSAFSELPKLNFQAFYPFLKIRFHYLPVKGLYQPMLLQDGKEQTAECQSGY